MIEIDSYQTVDAFRAYDFSSVLPVRLEAVMPGQHWGDIPFGAITPNLAWYRHGLVTGQRWGMPGIGMVQLQMMLRAWYRHGLVTGRRCYVPGVGMAWLQASGVHAWYRHGTVIGK